MNRLISRFTRGKDVERPLERCDRLPSAVKRERERTRRPPATAFTIVSHPPSWSARESFSVITALVTAGIPLAPSPFDQCSLFIFSLTRVKGEGEEGEGGGGGGEGGGEGGGGEEDEKDEEEELDTRYQADGYARWIRALGIPFDDTKLADGVYRDDTMHSIVPRSLVSSGLVPSRPGASCTLIRSDRMWTVQLRASTFSSARARARDVGQLRDCYKLQV